MAKPAEILLFDFLTEEFAASAVGSLLYDLELHDTVYQKITKPCGLRISEATGDLSPGPGGGLKEVDVDLVLICYARIEGKDKTERQEALQKAFEIQQEIVMLLVNNQTLNNRVCDVLVRKGSRGYDSLDGEPFAVANQPILINPSGARFSE